MNTYRISAEVNMSQDNWMDMARLELNRAIVQHGNANVKTAIINLTYQIWVKNGKV